MHIRKLALQGFKSFVDRQTFHFSDGISGVVGPNGCGKSNVVDAIKWCIGEQSAKSLRGSDMKDVIFNGSQARKKVGMAEVCITFARGEEPFPGDFARFEEVEVGRRLYRDGTSEYLLNQTRVRRRDVIELLMDTGVGNKLYSFIEQGEIGRIVQARPEQRRTLIEEAAGISRFKARKDEAETKLASTLQNLERASDVADEMGRRLRVLEKQVEKAARFRRLQARRRQLELAMGLTRYAALSGDRAALKREQLEQKRIAETSARELQRKEQEISSRRDEITVMSQVVGGLRDEISELEATRREKTSARHYQAEEAKRLTARLDVLAHDLSEAVRQRDHAAQEASALEEELQTLRGSLDGRDDALARLKQRASELSRGRDQTGAEVERLKQQHMALVHGVVKRRAQLESADHRIGEIEERRLRVQAAAIEAETVVASQVALASAAKESLARIEAERSSASGEIGAHQHALKAAETRLREIEQAVRLTDRAVTDAERTMTRTEARHHSLDDLRQQHAGVDDGARRVLDAVDAKGVLAEHLDVPVELEPLLARALDGALDYVLVGEGADLAAAARALCGSSRTGVIAASQELPSGGLAAQIGGSDVGRAALHRLLGVCHVADDIDEALRVHAETGERVVSRDGGLVQPDGVVIAGKRGQGSGAAILKRRRELLELEERLLSERELVEAAKAEASASRASLDQAREAQIAARAALDTAREQVRGHDQAVGEARLAVREHDRSLGNAGDRSAQLSRELERLGGRGADIEREKGEHVAAIQRALSQQEVAEQALQDAQSRLIDLDTRASRAREELTLASSEHTTLRERLRLAESGHARAARTAEDAERRRARADNEQRESKTRVDLLSAQDAGLNQEIQELGERQGQRREKLQGERTRLGRARESLQVHEDHLRGLREQTEGARAALQRLELKLQEIKLGINSLRENVEGRYQVSLPGLLDRLERDAAIVFEAGEQARMAVPVAGLVLDEVPDHRLTLDMLEDADQIRAQVSELERVRAKLDRLGEVNLAALEEYTEVSERYEWLDQQRTDLEESVEAIRRAIGKINRTCRERFRTAYDQVNRNFKTIYPNLVGGGTARLSLTNEDDLLETGVEIFVQPPGKRLQNLTLLSGGEKAMCAIALLFALFKVKPSPFCLLDEVDAPLDEGNGARFNAVLREMSSLTQFIVITHNKKTMEVVDTLYGVTMPDPGVSRLVTVQVS